MKFQIKVLNNNNTCNLQLNIELDIVLVQHKFPMLIASRGIENKIFRLFLDYPTVCADSLRKLSLLDI